MNDPDKSKALAIYLGACLAAVYMSGGWANIIYVTGAATLLTAGVLISEYIVRRVWSYAREAVTSSDKPDPNQV